MSDQKSVWVIRHGMVDWVAGVVIKVTEHKPTTVQLRSVAPDCLCKFCDYCENQEWKLRYDNDNVVRFENGNQWVSAIRVDVTEFDL